MVGGGFSDQCGVRRGARPVEFADVLAGARSGEGWAFASLFELVSSSLVAYFRGQGAWDPDGLANETLLRVFRDIARFRGGESAFRAWVFTVGRCRLIDARRAEARRPSSDEPLETVVAVGGDVEEDVWAMLGNDWVHDVVGCLAPDQREVLVLRVVADLTVDEIATVLGKTSGAVKALQRRALQAIRRRLDTRTEFVSEPVPFLASPDGSPIDGIGTHR
jgi:RNA polymerase sigma factor (sigma-70 family)